MAMVSGCKDGVPAVRRVGHLDRCNCLGVSLPPRAEDFGLGAHVEMTDARKVAWNTWPRTSI
jgi:hypothetical protein